MIQYFTSIEGINMEIDELVQVLNDAKLLPYEVATAVYLHLKPYMEQDFDFSSLEHIENNPDIVQFYLSAKQLKD